MWRSMTRYWSNMTADRPSRLCRLKAPATQFMLYSGRNSCYTRDGSMSRDKWLLVGLVQPGVHVFTWWTVALANLTTLMLMMLPAFTIENITSRPLPHIRFASNNKMSSSIHHVHTKPNKRSIQGQETETTLASPFLKQSLSVRFFTMPHIKTGGMSFLKTYQWNIKRRNALGFLPERFVNLAISIWSLVIHRGPCNLPQRGQLVWRIRQQKTGSVVSKLPFCPLRLTFALPSFWIKTTQIRGHRFVPQKMIRDATLNDVSGTLGDRNRGSAHCC